MVEYDFIIMTIVILLSSPLNIYEAVIRITVRNSNYALLLKEETSITYIAHHTKYIIPKHL